MSSVLDPTLDVARECNAGLFCNDHDGLLLGPYNRTTARRSERASAQGPDVERAVEVQWVRVGEHRAGGGTDACAGVRKGVGERRAREGVERVLGPESLDIGKGRREGHAVR